jgi:septum formation protein
VTLVLASLSATRRDMLTAAGVAFEVQGAPIDEEAAKESLRAEGLGARDLADALAELKARRVSAKRPGAIVLGCDQTLELDDGTMLDKPGNRLAEQLRTLSGRTHRLHSAVVACENGVGVWRQIETVKLVVRPLGETFIADYVAREGQSVSGCVGGYRIEGCGAQLFSRIDGSHFAILGLPLLPLLDWLRMRGLLAS